MHKINVLSFGSNNFNISLEELKDHLNFKLTTINNWEDIKEFSHYDVLLVHKNYEDKNLFDDILIKLNTIKILASDSSKINSIIFTDLLLLPTSIHELNLIIENSIIKKNYNTNSTIKIKDYILDKNEKRLHKNNLFILLTEKEIQLLELLIKKDKAFSKNQILEDVWSYAPEADTHTVETHIYRLRKKIKDKFSDENFILNNKNGYLL